MLAANRVQVSHRVDHFLIRFGLSASEDLEDQGDEVASVLVPIAAASVLALDIFGGLQASGPALTKLYEGMAQKIANLNNLTEAKQGVP
jgi:hypothetical protein